MTPIRRKPGWRSIALFVALAAPSQAYADNASGMRDYSGSIMAAVLVMLAIVILVAIFWEMFAAAAAVDAVLTIGESAELLEGGALSVVDLNETTYVIGKLADTAAWEGLEGFEVLDVPKEVWTPFLNELWIQTGIDEGATFLLTSPLGPQTLLSTEYGLAVYGVEIQQLAAAGYTLVTDLAGNLLMVPPI